LPPGDKKVTTTIRLHPRAIAQLDELCVHHTGSIARSRMIEYLITSAHGQARVVQPEPAESI
jgi:hypothetical protein